MYFWLCLCISDVREKCMFCRTRMSLLLPFMNSSSCVSCVVKKQKFSFFVLFSTIYILTFLGNSAIICAVWWDQQLHTPMYTLLANLSFLEICYISSNVPNMLFNFLSKTKAISYNGCILQFYIFLSLCHRTFLPGPDGIWQVCCHLLSIALSHHHDQESPRNPCVCLLGGWIPLVGYTCCPYLPSSILWSKYHWSLSLWSWGNAGHIRCPCPQDSSDL